MERKNDVKKLVLKKMKKKGHVISRGLLNLYLSGERNPSFERAKAFSDILLSPVDIWKIQKKYRQRMVYLKRYSKATNTYLCCKRGRPRKC